MRIRSQEGGGGQNNSDRITRIFKYTKAHHGSYLVVPVAARFIVGTSVCRRACRFSGVIIMGNIGSASWQPVHGDKPL